MPKRVLEGLVVSAKSPQTVVVRVDRRVMHPIYKKFIRKSKRFAVHDASSSFKEGDWVKIMESRPLSKTKKWVVLP